MGNQNNTTDGNSRKIVYQSTYSGSKYPEYGGMKLEDMPEYRRLPVRVKDYAYLEATWYGYVVSIDLDKMIDDYLGGYKLPLMAYFRLYPNGKRLAADHRMKKLLPN